MDEIGNKMREMLLVFNVRLLKSNKIGPKALKMGMIPLDYRCHAHGQLKDEEGRSFLDV